DFSDRRLRADIADFERAYAALDAGGEAFGMMVRPLHAASKGSLLAVHDAWRRYRDDALARSLQGGAIDKRERAGLLEALEEQSQAVLQAAERVLADLVQEEAAYRRSHLRTLY